MLNRILRILAWLAPGAYFRASVYRKCGVKIGKNVFMGYLVNMDMAHADAITIEDYVSIAGGVTIMAHVPTLTWQRVTQTLKGYVSPVKICRGAWLASNCIILPGVTIGEGAIVAAGAIVTRDVPPYTVAAGIPAKVVKQLYPIKPSQ